jgi:hypothetical protein
MAQVNRSHNIQWGGMQEFRKLLHEMPSHLRDRAAEIADHYTQVTYSQTLLAYPLGDTGNLRRGLVVEERITNVGVFNAVVSKSKHAHLWEFGTVNRKTQEGWDRGRVRPARDLGREGLIPIAIRNRRAMNHAFMDMMVEEGFELSGVLSAA